MPRNSGNAVQDLSKKLRNWFLKSFADAFDQEPELFFESGRLKTFKSGQWPFGRKSAVSAVKMAEAGFYKMPDGSRDGVRCAYCSCMLENFERNDDPWEEHYRHTVAKHNLRCPFVLLRKPERKQKLQEFKQLLIDRYDLIETVLKDNMNIGSP